MKAKILSIMAFAASLGTASAQFPAGNDLWDISQGTVVTASSPTIPGYIPESIFGHPGPLIGWTYFDDTQPAGYVHVVEWETQADVNVGLIRLFAFGDDFLNNGREFSQLTIKAKSPGSSTYDITVLSYTPTHPYTFVGPNELLINQIISPTIVARYFRAEFEQYTAGFSFDGPRIVELDAFSPPPPEITGQPGDTVVNVGMPAEFNVVATGTGSLQYQWFKDGSPIAGATSTKYRIPIVTPNDMGTYSVSITDANGTTFSGAATLNIDLLNVQQSVADVWDVNTGSAISAISPYLNFAGTPEGMFGGVSAMHESYLTYFADNQPTGTVHYVEWTTPSPVTVRSLRLFAYGDPFLNHGREFESVTFKAKSAGSTTYDIMIGTFSQTHPYTFLDNQLILDTSITPVTSGAFRAEFNQYTAGNGFDGPRIVEIDGFEGRPLLRPSVVTNPESKTVPKNTKVTFKVVARGGDLAYQWKFMGQPISGATTDTYVLKHAKQNEQGYYSVTVSNPAGTAESVPALLLVTH